MAGVTILGSEVVMMEHPIGLLLDFLAQVL